MIVVVAIYVVSIEIDVDNFNNNRIINSFVAFFSLTISLIVLILLIMSTSSIVNTLFEIILLNNIIVYDQTNIVNKLIVIINSFSNI